MKTLLFLLATTLAVPAAAQGPTRSPTRSITYETGVCFGRCPVYSVTIYSDGRATFTGRRFTAVEGTREFRVPAGTYLSFARHLEPLRPARAENIRYSGDRCRVMATDLPSATVTWHGQGGQRSLYFYYGCDMRKNRAIADRLRRAPDLLPQLGDFIGRPR
ncbi:MAG TPA: DUF6438 domain-containing protein [Allosphingosinicella sp.]|nr:DUF6438 domain-containing protein [Allosphingosinicella sp.]